LLRSQSREESSRLIDGNNSVDEIESLGSDGEVQSLVGHVSTSPLRPRQDNDGSHTSQLRSTNPFNSSRSLQTPSTRPILGSDGSRTPPSRDAISPSHLNYDEQSERLLRSQSREESSRLIDGNNSVDEVESLGNDGEVQSLVGHENNMGAPYSDDDLEHLDDLDDLSESHQGGSDDEMSYFSVDSANTDIGRSNLLVTQNVEEERNDDNLSAEDRDSSDTSDDEHDEHDDKISPS